MRSRAAAFTDVNATIDVNATTDLVLHTVVTAAGRDVVRGQVVEAAAATVATTAAAATATVVIATADNATTAAAADTLFRQPTSPPSPLPPHQYQHQPPNRTDPSTDNDRVHRQSQSLGTVMVLMVVTVVVLGTVGLLTCVLHHYNQQYNPAVPCLSAPSGPHHRLSTPPPPPPSPPTKKKKPTTITATTTTTTATTTLVIASSPLPPPSPLSTSITDISRNSSCRSCSASSRTAMLTMRSNNGLTREHDHQVRLHSVRTDLGLDLPPRIHLPDGEEYPYDSMAKIHLRNSEQEREIYQKCIRGPPNRTIWQPVSECGGKLSQPHRSSSTSGLTSLSTSPSEVDSVTRCNSVSSRCLPRTGFPPVDNIQSLSSLTMVPCLSHVDKQTLSQ
ncbi:Hypothetical protein CINCED_3A012677 [Cinara cedri]|uniref:Uncharacterized protein n=1 Tax=Cinara cedri TaxID=506608 RepID=A0A5E4MRR2_9HEMI|nr:Hypothetical protein CINCED_3A012677 [Cinara cedri]